MADDLITQLAVLGDERRAARARAVELSGQIAQVARQALDAGATKTQVATAAQISRTALDTMLNDGR